MGRDAQHVYAAHARGEQRLMGITQGGVGDQCARLGAHPFGKFSGAKLLEQVAAAGRDRRGDVRSGLDEVHMGEVGPHPALHVGMAVDRDLAQVAQDAGGTVAALGQAHQFGRVVDEARGHAAGGEVRMVDDVLDKLQVGGNPANAEFAQAAVHAADRLVRARRPCSHLDQQRVVVGRDHRARIGGAAV